MCRNEAHNTETVNWKNVTHQYKDSHKAVINSNKSDERKHIQHYKLDLEKESAPKIRQQNMIVNKIFSK